LEIAGGAVFGIAVGLGATLLTCAVSSRSNGDDDIPPCLAAFVITTPLMIPLGTWLVGTAMDGDGSLLAAYAGMGAALATSGAMALAMGNHFDDGPVPTTLGYTLALVGPAIGYELTSHAHKGRTLSVAPMLSPHTQGLALAGTF